jgi:hypothetical protein
MAEISKITLPSGNTYELKDATARQMISGGVSFIVAWDGTGTAVAANVPKGVNAGGVTGTLEAADAQAGAFYLVKSASTPSSETLDIYDEYVVIGSTTKSWEKIGDTQLNLSDVVTGVSLTKQTDVVLGEATTFTNASSSVSFTGGTTDKVLGEATTFSVSKPAITVTPSTTNIKATASGAAVGANGTAKVITGFGTHTTDTFVKSVTAETGKNLVTTTVPNVTGNTTVTIPNVTGNTNVTIPNVTSVGSASTWNFAMGSGDAAETLIISGANSTAPTLGTALSASKVTLGTALTATNTTLGTAKTVATGATSTTGTGDAVVTGVTVGDSATAITALGTPTTADALTGVKVTTQPTIALATGATAGTGVISVATGISSATAGDQTVTVGTNDKVTAVTGIGTGTAAAQTITVGTNDKVTVLKNTTDVSVTKGNA